MKLTKEALISAQVRVGNADDADRKYEIRGDVTLNEGQYTSTYNGTVDTLDGQRVADFYAGNGMQTNISYGHDVDDEAQVEILIEVQAFIAAAKGYTLSDN